MAYQTRDLLEAMQKDAGLELTELKVDGGASVNNALMQFQADLLGVKVRRPVVSETTALGAAYLAGLAVGYWRDTADVTRNWALEQEFAPQLDAATRKRLYAGWQKAVSRGATGTSINPAVPCGSRAIAPRWAIWHTLATRCFVDGMCSCDGCRGDPGGMPWDGSHWRVSRNISVN